MLSVLKHFINRFKNLNGYILDFSEKQTHKMINLEKLLIALKLDDKKKAEIYKKKALQTNLEIIFLKYKPNNRLFYTLACTAPKKINLLLVADLIDQKIIKNENVLRAVYKKLDKDSKLTADNIRSYIEINTKSSEENIKIIKQFCKLPISKKLILIKLKSELPFADSKLMLDLVNEYKIENDKIEIKKTSDWLDEGEISMLHKPGENPQINEKILKEHLQRTKGKVVTRFPPEPNGILHIGHAKAMNINFEYAKKYGGYTYLRFDDTNPKNEDECFFDSIVEDIEWLGFKPHKVTASSDYFGAMIDFGRFLLKKNKAYICELSVEEVKERRKKYAEAIEKANQEEVNDFAIILSPYRNRPLNENLEIYDKMVNKKCKEGEYTLRFKMDLSSKNPLMFDLVGMRIIDCTHVRTADKYNLYPTYEFALCVSDSLEDVTHSFCTREFFTRQESYNWLLDNLEIYKPVQWEFSRLNLVNTIVSKRKLTALKKFGIELDDPRLYTLKGMRRRGIPPNAINKFVQSVGITFSESTINPKRFESFIKDELNKTARRVMCVIEPIKVFIRNASSSIIIANDNCEGGIDREINSSPYIYIEKSDFNFNHTGGFLRFTSSQPVGLYLLGVIKFIEFKEDTIITEFCDEKPLKYIHWVDVNSTKVELRLYSDLFASSKDNQNACEEINHDSLEIVEAYCDKRIIGCKAEDKFQFQRIGYFCVDRDTTDSKIVLNRTIELK